MSTIKSRLNITLSDDTKDALGRLASRNKVPDATQASRLIEVALELEEDILWDELAVARDGADVTYISHDQAW